MLVFGGGGGGVPNISISVLFSSLKLKPACSFETSETAYSQTQRIIPDDLNPQEHRCEKQISEEKKNLGKDYYRSPPKA